MKKSNKRKKSTDKIEDVQPSSSSKSSSDDLEKLNKSLISLITTSTNTAIRIGNHLIGGVLAEAKGEALGYPEFFHISNCNQLFTQSSLNPSFFLPDELNIDNHLFHKCFKYFTFTSRFTSDNFNNYLLCYISVCDSSSLVKQLLNLLLMRNYKISFDLLFTILNNWGLNPHFATFNILNEITKCPFDKNNKRLPSLFNIKSIFQIIEKSLNEFNAEQCEVLFETFLLMTLAPLNVSSHIISHSLAYCLDMFVTKPSVYDYFHKIVNMEKLNFDDSAKLCLLNVSTVIGKRVSLKLCYDFLCLKFNLGKTVKEDRIPKDPTLLTSLVLGGKWENLNRESLMKISPVIGYVFRSFPKESINKIKLEAFFSKLSSKIGQVPGCEYDEIELTFQLMKCELLGSFLNTTERLNS